MADSRTTDSVTATGAPLTRLYARAEYDRTNNRVVALEGPSGQRRPTHNPRVLGAETEWLDVDYSFPEGFNSRFPHLLHSESMQFTYDRDSDKVVIEYPDADFSLDAIRDALKQGVNDRANAALRETDWYVVRHAETKKAIPKDIRERRQAIRTKVDEYHAALETATEEELLEFHVDFEGQPPIDAGKPEPKVKGGDGRRWRTNATSPDGQGEPVEPETEEDAD